jgi:CheY-like chemotaxis protein
VDHGYLMEKLQHEHGAVARVTGNRLRVRPKKVYVLTDEAMLQRILGNLVSNALRYTHNGGVLVGARRRATSVRIDVYDTGPGIPADALDDIFLEFHQLGNPERDRRKGLGLGLAIVKRLADLLGHGIEVRSRLRRGSRFSVTVPLCSAPQPRAAAAAYGGVGADLHGRRVLVLDDDPAVLDAMQALLENWGCDVITSTTPEEAEALAPAAERLDMLIVDYRLSRDASGIDAIDRLQALRGARIPALVITGDTAPDRLREAEESGYPLLHKPVKPPQLRDVMRRLMLGIQPPPTHVFAAPD